MLQAGEGWEADFQTLWPEATASYCHRATATQLEAKAKHTEATATLCSRLQPATAAALQSTNWCCCQLPLGPLTS
jgi:hypothetical protein